MTVRQPNGGWCRALALLSAGWLATALPQLAAGQDKLAADAYRILKKHCYECHGRNPANVKKKLRVLDQPLLLGKKRKLVVPGKPDDSLLIQRIEDKEEPMPPNEGKDKRPPVPKAELDVLKAWIKAGAAPFPKAGAGGKTQAKQGDGKRPSRGQGAKANAKKGEGKLKPKSPARGGRDKKAAPEPIVGRGDKKKKVLGADYVFQVILDDLRRMEDKDQKRFARYFSIAHLVDAGVNASELELHRKALAKAINHLSRGRDLVVPRAVDGQKTVFAVDIRRLGWQKQPFTAWKYQGDRWATSRSPLNLFDLVLLEYPYGVIPGKSKAFQDLVTEYLLPAGLVHPLPYVRADWFVSVATQAPLYEDLLRLPLDLPGLEALLGVDIEQDVAEGTAKRAGMSRSQVTRRNRVVQHHPARLGGFLWLSLDFRPARGPRHIFRDPIRLSPDGGEMIFGLPNGLQAYFLTDARRRRLEAEPREIATDPFAGDNVVRNGLSCIRCHDQGMKPFTDEVRADLLKHAGAGNRRAVIGLYPEQVVMNRLVSRDKARFLAALKRLGIDPAEEPLRPVTKRFLDDPLSLTGAAAELGLADPQVLKKTAGTGAFADSGLGTLASGGGVRREPWETAFPRIVRDGLHAGTPVVPIDGTGLKPQEARYLDSPLAPQVDLKTNHPDNVFRAGDRPEVIITNRSTGPIFVELVGTGARGNKHLLAVYTVPAGSEKTYRWKQPLKGTSGKNLVTLFAGARKFETGETLRMTVRKDEAVRERFVHLQFYRLKRGPRGFEVEYDPADVVKKTLAIITK
jgi:serine/threonine-protein kinase